MAYSSITNPRNFMNPKLYAGNGSAGNAITGVGFQPDLVWLKSRTNTEYQNWYDSIRGVTKRLVSNLSSAETTLSGLTAFGTDGFTVGAADTANQNSNNFVSWNWKAGTAFSNDASATGVGTIDSTASVNQTAGFSIVKYTGTGSNATVAHGLGLAPEIMICKNLSATENWVVYVKSLGNTKRLILDTTGAVGTDATIFNSTTPNTTIFGIGENAGANGSGHGQIAYCFASVQGYSKISSFVGNGNVNGPYVHLGFKPAFLMIKDTTGTGEWLVWDNKRSPSNEMTKALAANDSLVEDTTKEMDFLSNGFKIRTTDTNYNASGNTNIFMAFAEEPFVASNFNAATAR